MFGIMTKKDKRIKELEAQIAYMYYKHPQIIETRANVITLGAKTIVEKDVHPEYYKQEIAQQMMREIVNHIHYDVIEDNGKAVITGYLRVVAKTI